MDIRREILRNVVLSQAVAPLGRKDGPTNRAEEPPPGTKLEYFVVAAVNSGWPFYDLVERILEAGRQPDCIFDLAYEAQAASARNRLGGKVNYGQIILLIPLVAAQVLEYLDTGRHDDVEAILARTAEVLKNTTERDVAGLERFIHVGYELSALHYERMGRPTSIPELSFVGRYKSLWEAAQDYQHIHAVREWTQGYPYCRRVYRFLLHDIETGVLPASELIYRFLIPEFSRADAVADTIVAGLYLVLTRHPDSVLFV
ncbi:MAG TPA: triphosphoribosyl-dephospho-CoA synthase [Thermoanaerobaculia bacterium]|nr:triphosphoribosyl-dephospho-CoA synthase [Thermoanaerobaculia bacterium]